MFDVVILGGGLTGLTTAIALSKHKIKVAIVEKNDIKNIVKSERTITLSQGSIDFYKTIGVDFNLENVGKISDIFITNHGGGKTEFCAKDINIEYIGFVIKNSDIIENLIKNISQNITIFDNQTYTDIQKLDNGFEINKKIYCKTIIACDGINSNIFDIFDIDKSVIKYDQTALMFNIKHSNEHKNIATEHFTPNGPFATLPLKNQNESTVVWSQNDDLHNTFDDKNLINDMSEYCPKWLGKIDVITPVLQFPLALQVAKNYYKNTIFLLGATARNLHPLAGQAFNVILQDLQALSQILSDWNNKGGEQKKLYKYAIKWRCKRAVSGFGITAFTHLTDAIFSNNSASAKIIQNLSLFVCDKVPFIKKYLMKKS